MSRLPCGDLAVLILVISASVAAPDKHTASPAPASVQRPESSAHVASHIVHELKALAQRHKLPAVIHQMTNEIPYREEDYYDHEIYKLEDDVEPTPDPAVSSSGFNMKGVLGLVEYLILLILLKGSVNHIAERYFKSRGRRSSQEDLLGLANEIKHEDLEQTISDLYLKHLKSKKHKRY